MMHLHGGQCKNVKGNLQSTSLLALPKKIAHEIKVKKFSKKNESSRLLETETLNIYSFD